MSRHSAARDARSESAPLELTGTAGSFDGWMRGLPGNIDVQGGFGGGKIAIKGSVNAKGTNLAITSEGPDVSAFGPYIRLPVPGGGPYALNAKAGTLRSTTSMPRTPKRSALWYSAVIAANGLGAG